MAEMSIDTRVAVVESQVVELRQDHTTFVETQKDDHQAILDKLDRLPHWAVGVMTAMGGAIGFMSNAVWDIVRGG